jgi:hypothetical protein
MGQNTPNDELSAPFHPGNPSRNANFRAERTVAVLRLTANIRPKVLDVLTDSGSATVDPGSC